MARHTSSKSRDSAHSYQQKPVLFRPCIVGFMSVNGSREYHSDLSQMKFINAIPKGRLSWDLNHNIDKAIKRTTDDNNEKIDLLLKFLLDQGSRLNFPEMTFIAYRRTLINVMYSAFNVTEPIGIRASLFNNNIYIYDIESPQEIQRRRSRSNQEKIFCAWGYKFEQYMLSDLPTLPPDINKPVIENEEFSLYYCSQIGDHKLFYGAQIDGLLATSDSVPPPPETTDPSENINYLRQHYYVELKTNKELQYYKQEHFFKRYKLLRCWCQCYLANLKGLLVGFRNDQGIVQRLQWFDTAEIAEYCKHEWDPETSLNFLDYFLSFVKKSFNSYSKSHGNLKQPLTLDFYIDGNKKIKVAGINEDLNALLPDWYIETQNKI